MRLRGQGGGEPAVVIADRLPQGVVAPRPAEPLDVLVLVERRDALSRELAADPVRFFEHTHTAPGARGRQRRRDAARPAAHDEDVAGLLLDAWTGLAALQHRRGGIAGCPHRHHVEQGRHLIIRLGSQSASWGKAITMTSATTWSAMNGQMEWKMSPIVMSGGVTPLR